MNRRLVRELNEEKMSAKSLEEEKIEVYSSQASKTSCFFSGFIQGMEESVAECVAMGMIRRRGGRVRKGFGILRGGWSCSWESEERTFERERAR